MKQTLEVDSRLHYEKIKDILDYPKVIRVTEFDEDSLEDFEKDLNDATKTNQPVIPIVIDTLGGQAYSVLGMIAAIEQVDVPVATIVTTKAMSCGAILFSFGTEGYRYMHPDAILMIHDVASCSWGKIEELKSSTKHTEDLNKRIYTKMAKHLGHSPNRILELIKEQSHVDWFLTAKEAKKHNIVNHIKVPSFNVEVSMDVQFK